MSDNWQYTEEPPPDPKQFVFYWKRRAEQAEYALENLRSIVFKASHELDRAYVDALLQVAPPEEKQP